MNALWVGLLLLYMAMLVVAVEVRGHTVVPKVVAAPSVGVCCSYKQRGDSACVPCQPTRGAAG